MSKEGKKKKFIVKTSFFKDLKAFLTRGNIIDLAVAVIIGAAFGKITSSLVADIIMPPIGLLIDGVALKDLVWVIKYNPGDVANVTINYGLFLQAILEFFIIGITIFIFVRIVKRVSSIKFETKEAAEAHAKALEEKAAEEKAVAEKAASDAAIAKENSEKAVQATIRSEELLKEILTALQKK